MDIKSFKYEYLTTTNQFIIYDKKGNVLNSCEGLFELSEANIFTYFDFLVSIENIISNIENHKLFVIPKIEIENDGKIYDFLFKHIEYDGSMVNLLIITSNKDNFDHLKEMQQQRNEAILKISEYEKIISSLEDKMNS